MATVQNAKGTTIDAVLYMAMELSSKKWKLGFSDGSRQRLVTIEAGDWPALHEAIRRAKEKFKQEPDVRVVSCYEAGRDGFWIHRRLVADGIVNQVVDSASIEVNRRQRRAKTDSVDVKGLLRLLQRDWQGERAVMRVVQVPTVEAEDNRCLHRERGRLVQERGAHSARIQALLVAHGVKLKVDGDFLPALEAAHSPGGYALGEDLKAELRREYARYRLVADQVKALEAEQRARVKAAGEDKALGQVAHLQQLRGVGWQSSWLLVMEFFAWRAFRNRRQLAACAGLSPTPYSSGESQREQGISKAGNRRIRTLMVELSWLWLQYQPDSALSQWFERRFAHGGKRMRRIGIVALARKLLVALWRFVEDGVVPEGAVLQPAPVAR